jgi:hypothetical protein
MATTKSKIILSAKDIFDLSSGLGDVSSLSLNGVFNTWRTFYWNYTTLINQVDQSRILGAEMLAWGTAINGNNFEMNVWMRTAVFGDRLWSAGKTEDYQLIERMVPLQRTLQDLGIDVAPLTSEFCEHTPIKCWPLSPSELNPVRDI